MSTPIEDRAVWALHRATRDEMRARGYCAQCAEQIAFAVTDFAERLPPRKMDLCGRCQRVHRERRAA